MDCYFLVGHRCFWIVPCLPSNTMSLHCSPNVKKKKTDTGRCAKHVTMKGKKIVNVSMSERDRNI